MSVVDSRKKMKEVSQYVDIEAFSSGGGTDVEDSEDSEGG
jgi:hypothetical protein